MYIKGDQKKIPQNAVYVVQEDYLIGTNYRDNHKF